MVKDDMGELELLDTRQRRLSAVAYLVSSVLELSCAVVDTENNIIFEAPKGHIGHCFCSRLGEVTDRRYNLDHFFERCHRMGVGAGNSIYSCPFGLVNVLVPVFDDGEYIAALQVGPFLMQDSEELLLRHGLSELDISSPDESLMELTQFLRKLPKGNTDYLVALTRMAKGMLSDDTLDIHLRKQSQPELSDTQPTGDFDLLYAIQQFVSSHYAEPNISLEMVAKHVYVHPSYVSHIFSDQFKTGFRDYINSLRIKRAKELLVTTSKPIGEICRLTGYSDHSYFNKVFRQREGMTPTQYRTGAHSADNQA